VNLTSAPDGADLPGDDVEASVQLAQGVLDAISKGVASFALITAERS
jgi:hypothetical protein